MRAWQPVESHGQLYLTFSSLSISEMWKGIAYFSYTENSISMIFYSNQTHTQFYVLFYLKQSYYSIKI